MPKLLVEGKELAYEPGQNLMGILLAAGFFVDNPCSGRGICGKCKVKHIAGSLPPLTGQERDFLNIEEEKQGVRLACFVKPQDDIGIELLIKEKKHEVMTSGYVPEFQHQPAIWKKTFTLAKPTLEKQMTYEEIFVNAAQAQYIDWRILRTLPFNPGICTAVYSEDCLIAIEEGDTTQQLYGLAIDIGTTTVAMALVDLVTGKELGTEAMINAQKKYGLDVLTRITYALEHPQEGREQLQTAMVESLNQMLEALCARHQVDPGTIYEIVVAANCTMLHLLLGVDTASLGRLPFAPVFTRAQNIPAADLGLKVSPGARLYCLPSVSAYIGADIVAGAYVAQLNKEKGNVLFIDIGTNGEIVLAHNGRLLSCSCAAGPALEGMNISAGMRAASGAVEDVRLGPWGVNLKVIGDEKPLGICGSGILAAVRELLLHGLIRKEGALVKKDTLPEDDYRSPMLVQEGRKRCVRLVDDPRIVITQGDVRQVQLAKGAILSGFYALLAKAGITMDDLDKVMIAGQFGAHLPVESLSGTGILPQDIDDKVVYIGNSSKTGAYMALLSTQVRKEIEELANSMEYMELGASEGYERLFIECLKFPVPNVS